MDEFYLYISSEEKIIDAELLINSCLAQGSSGTNGFMLIVIASIYSVVYATHEQNLKIYFRKDGVKKRQYFLKIPKSKDREEIALFISSLNCLNKEVSFGYWRAIGLFFVYIGLTILLTSIAYYFASNEYVGRRAIVHLAVELLQGLGGIMILIIGGVIMAIQLMIFVKKKKYKNQIVEYK